MDDYHYDYADQLDLEWRSLLQKQLECFSSQNKNNPRSYDEVLEKVFCSAEADGIPEDNYKDKEISEKCLTELLSFLSHRSGPIRQTQIHHVLKLAKYTMKDETCFINLNANNVLLNLMYVCQPLSPTSDKKTDLLFLELLNSFMEHLSGLKQLLENKYWNYAYKLVLDNRGFGEESLHLGYDFLAKFLEKVYNFNQDGCSNVIKFMAEPLFTSINSTNMNELQPVAALKPSVLCVAEILERLLEKYSAGVLNCFLQLNVDVASDNLSSKIGDKPLCLILYRIALSLSFFKVSDVFDGIKNINEDPLAIIGFLRIIETCINKGALDLVLDLCYYSLKYTTYLGDKLPSCVINGRPVNLEGALVSLQLEPIMLAGLKIDLLAFKVLSEDLVRLTHLTHLLQCLSVKCLQLGNKLRDVYPNCPFELFTYAVKCISRSKHLYSKEQLGNVFEAIIYSFQDAIKHIKMQRSTDIRNEIALQEYVTELGQNILMLIETFDLSWRDSVKILELAQTIIGGWMNYQWPPHMLIQGIKLLQEVISRRLAPAMSLLIDCNEDLNDLGPLLYQQCFTSEWEVRRAVLEVVHTIAVSANKSFPSFGTILIDASLPSLISTMALNDCSAPVRATAFKCLHEMIMIEDMEKIIPKNFFINKVLDVSFNDPDITVKKEAIKLITRAYLHRDGLEPKILVKVYKRMQEAALCISCGVAQVEALEFWANVTRKYLSTQGWMDRKFPSVIFKKRIICMTNKEIHKRLYKVLTQLSAIGCLNVYEKVCRYQYDSLPSEAKAFINQRIMRFYLVFQEYDVTVESMRMEEMSKSPDNNYEPSFSSDDTSGSSEQALQDIINNTMMDMCPLEPLYIQDEDIYQLVDKADEEQNKMDMNRPMTPSEFVEFINKRSIYLTETGETEDLEIYPPRTEDVYNIIDY